jgi:hypothetical protein
VVDILIGQEQMDSAAIWGTPAVMPAPSWRQHLTQSDGRFGPVLLVKVDQGVERRLDQSAPARVQSYRNNILPTKRNLLCLRRSSEHGFPTNV